MDPHAAADQAELRRRAALAALADMTEHGWAVVPRAALGLDPAVVEAAHASIWDAADRLAYHRAGAFPERPFRSIVRAFDDPEWSELAPPVFGGVGGFTQHQFLPEQVALQTDPVIEAFYRDLYLADGRLAPGPGEHAYRRPDGAGPALVAPDPRDPRAAGAPVLFYTYAERANITLPGALQAIVGQIGAKPHLDCNPWEPDYGRGDVAVDPAAEEKAHYMARRWPIDRPYQSYVSLTDCPGGPLSGGMGVAEGSHEQFRRLRELPPHGKNPRWGNLVRVLPQPGGAWRAEAGADDARAVDELHADILGAMRFPRYSAGDLVIWDRETTHRGCERNFANAHQARVYVNKLPLNLRNDTFAAYQADQTLAGVQTHGRRADRNEAAHVAMLTPYQRAALGIPG
jgi:hypothetical protein